MPPVQCPDCGRFLKRDFIASLDAVTPTACPRCGTDLVAGMFEHGASPTRTPAPTLAADVEVATVAVDPDAVGAADAAAGEASTPAPEPAPSVRPPDLEPDDVRRYDDDVLHGWDLGAEPGDPAPLDRPPFPADTVWLGAGAAGGAALAFVVARWRGGSPVSGAVLGGLAGAVAVAIGRQVWRLEA